MEADESQHESNGPTRGRSGNRGRRFVGFLVFLLVGAGIFAVYANNFRPNPNAEEFCRRAGEIADVADPAVGGQGSAEGANRVRITAARLVLLHEQLEPVAPRSLRNDLAQTIADYRGVVRSASPDELQSAGTSEAAQRVAQAVESDCPA